MKDPIIEIVEAMTDAIVVCDRLSHCVAADEGVAAEADDIRAALERGDEYLLGGGAAAGYVIRSAPEQAYAAT